LKDDERTGGRFYDAMRQAGFNVELRNSGTECSKVPQTIPGSHIAQDYAATVQTTARESRESTRNPE
jgi:hypothetical protein